MKARNIGVFVAVGAAVGALAIAQEQGVAPSSGSDMKMQELAEKIISRYKNVMEKPPSKVPSRDVVDGALFGNGNLGAVISGKPERQQYWISKNNFWRLRHGHRQGGPRLFGGLDISIPALQGATYRIEQDLFPAMTTSRFGKDGTNVIMRSFVPATDDVLIVEISAEGGAVEGECLPWPAKGRGSVEQTGQSESVFWITKAFTNDVVIPTFAAGAMRILGQEGLSFKIEPSAKITIVMAVQSNFDADDPLAAARKKALETTETRIKELEVRHSQWWREFWARSLVKIPDPDLEQAYYVANYMMGSGMKDKDFPPGLFSLWVTHDDPRWAGDYHLNFDFQSQYYALYKNNHIEQADTFDQPILDFMERGRWYAKNALGVRGVYYPVGIGPKGIEPSLQAGRSGNGIELGGVFMGQRTNAAYCLVNMAMRWFHTYDLDYAKKVYPFVIEVANFWEDYLRFEPAGSPPSAKVEALPPFVTIDGVPVDKIPVGQLPPGRYVSYNDSIQEWSGHDVNNVLSLGLVHNAFTLVLDMSKELGVDADRRDKWAHILKNLSPFPTFEKNGVTVFRYSEVGTEWINGNSVGLQHIYPGGAIGLDDDPKLLEIARNTISAEGRNWKNDNGENSHYPAAVRVGYDPGIILERLKDMWLNSRRMLNGFPDTMEQCSTVPNTINEMICMSHRQVLRLFPVWPKDKDVQFWNLRAEGAFLVSSALKGGDVPFVKIHSEKGRDCTLVNPWPGKAIVVYRDGKKVDVLKGDRVVLKTKAGDTVVLGPEDKGYPKG